MKRIMCWPRVMLDSSDGEIRSPPNVVIASGVRLRSHFRSVARLANPPIPPFGPDLIDVVDMKEGDPLGLGGTGWMGPQGRRGDDQEETDKAWNFSH